MPPVEAQKSTLERWFLTLLYPGYRNNSTNTNRKVYPNKISKQINNMNIAYWHPWWQRMEREATSDRQQNLMSHFVQLGKRSPAIFSVKDSSLSGEAMCTTMADKGISAEIISNDHWCQALIREARMHGVATKIPFLHLLMRTSSQTWTSWLFVTNLK